MYYQNYEDYMRSVLGYQNSNNPMNSNYISDDEYYYPNVRQNTEELEALYPEVYKIVYPMICAACDRNNNRPFTKELIDQMTEEIYTNIEAEMNVEMNVNVKTELRNGDVKNPNAKEEKDEVKETRQRNYLLQDLIRILLLREVLGRPGRPNRPQRPPFQGGPRPPFPGGPGSMRPPMMRDFNLYN